MPSPDSRAGRPQPVGAGRYQGRPRVDGAPTGRTGATQAKVLTEDEARRVAVNVDDAVALAVAARGMTARLTQGYVARIALLPMSSIS
jgi:hypothetical protein